MVRRLLPAVAALLVIALTVSLGNWQVRRAHEKLALAEHHRQALSLPPVSLNALAAAEPSASASLSPEPTRRVSARGVFLPDRAILIDNRTHHGIAGFHVLMPMRLVDGGRLVLVLRGWLPSDPANRWAWPAIETPPGVVELDGEVEAQLPQSLQLGRDPVPGPGDRIWQYFSLPKYRQWSGLVVEAFIIRQSSNLEDGLVREWPQAGHDVDRHYGYAFQWYGMAVATVVLWIWYGRRRRSVAADHR